MDGYERFTRNQYMFFIIWITSIIAAIFAWKGRKEVLQVVQGFPEKKSS